MKLTHLLSILFFSISSMVTAQSITNIKAAFLDDKVIVTYDLIATDPQQKFDIDLYSSVNNYSQPLKHIRGDVGKGLTPSKGKRIEVDVLAELGKFDGNITFEVRAGYIVSQTVPITAAPATEFLNPIGGSKFKRGKFYQVKWDGITDSQIQLELYRNGVKQNEMGRSVNGKDFGWVVPASTKPGSDYTIKLVSGPNKSPATSKTFKISRKIPLGLKIAPILIIGGVAAALLGGGSGGGDGGGGGVIDPVVTTLPAPPEPGG